MKRWLAYPIWWWQTNKGIIYWWLKQAVFWFRFAAYAIPIAFLLYVLYINYLPFGYDKTFTIMAGSPGDTSGKFYLAPSRTLSGPIQAPDGSTYREFSGIIYAVLDPGVVLNNANINASIIAGTGASIIPPYINFDPSSIKWNDSWNFATSTPADLTGNAFHFDDCEAFDGTSQLQLPNSVNEFDSGPFTLYAEWTPQDSTDDFQQIVGHRNWELSQDKTDVKFQVGRMNNDKGPFYSITYPVPPTFFNNEHSAIAIYNPSINGGYIQLYIDDTLAGESAIGTSTIWVNFGKNNLSFGKNGYSNATYFRGCISEVDFEDSAINDSAEASFNFSGTELKLPIESFGTTTLSSIKLDVH